MPRTLYYGSGSPYAWKVWLALEHKQLAYELMVLSFDRGETRTPEFLALNPRGKVPVLVDEGVALAESTAIAEYLEERYPERPLLPRDPLARARARRIAIEADSWFAEAIRGVRHYVFGRDPASEPEVLAAALQTLGAELARFDGYLGAQDFLVGDLSLADFTLYPHLRLLLRFEQRQPAIAVSSAMPPGLAAWQERMAALPYMERTIPPHWKA